MSIVQGDDKRLGGGRRLENINSSGTLEPLQLTTASRSVRPREKSVITQGFNGRFDGNNGISLPEIAHQNHAVSLFPKVAPTTFPQSVR